MRVCIALLLGFLFWNETMAQCAGSAAIGEGTVLVHETFDGRHQLTGTARSVYSDYRSTPEGFTATLTTTAYDDRQRKLSTLTASVRCEGGIYYMNMENFVDPEQLKVFGSMDVEMVADELPTPSNLTVGQKLSDAGIRIKARKSPIPIALETTITDREVESIETLKTEMGSIQCFKISYLVQTEAIVSFTLENVEFWAPEYGPIRSEVYRNGQLIGYTQIKSIGN